MDSGKQSGTDSGSTAMERYTVAQAARRLGVSERAVRSRIERGNLLAERQGKRSWIVLLPTIATAAQSGITPEPSTLNTDESGTGAVDERQPTAVESGTDTALLVGLIERQEQRIMELAGQVGYLQAELEQARSTIKQLQPPPDEAKSTSTATESTDEGSTSLLSRIRRRVGW